MITREKGHACYCKKCGAESPDAYYTEKYAGPYCESCAEEEAE